MKLGILFGVLVSCARAATLTVGTGQTYTDIQTAVNASNCGDTVMVNTAGSPYVGFRLTTSHANCTVSTPLTITTQSAAQNAVVISSPTTTNDGINISGVDYVYVSGFTITSMPRYGIGFTLSTGSKIQNCWITGASSDGILLGFTPLMLVSGNHVSASGTFGSDHQLYVGNSNKQYSGIIVRNNVLGPGNSGSGHVMQANPDCSTLDPTGYSYGRFTGLLFDSNVLIGAVLGTSRAIALLDSQYAVISNNVAYSTVAFEAVVTGTQVGCNYGDNNDVFVNNTWDTQSAPGVRQVQVVNSAGVTQPSAITVFNDLVVSTDTRECVDSATGGICVNGINGVSFTPGTRITPTTAGSNYFTSYSGHNYTLISGSPAIHAGVTSATDVNSVVQLAPVVDAAANVRTGGFDTGAYEFGTSAATADGTPTTPGTPTFTSSAYATSLSWTASTDNWYIVWYLIYRDGTLYALSPTNSYADASVNPGETHTYSVVAVNPNGTLSAASGTGSITIPGIVGCMNSDNTQPVFRNIVIPTTTGSFEFLTDLMPFGAPTVTNAFIGLSPNVPNNFPTLSVDISFTSGGVIQAWNNAVPGLTADSVYPYTSGTMYHLRVDGNTSTDLYTVNVSTCSVCGTAPNSYACSCGAETALATNYSFRFPATSLAYLSTVDNSTGASAACNPVMNGRPLKALTFQSPCVQSLTTQTQSCSQVPVNGTGVPLMDHSATPTLTASRALTALDHGSVIPYSGSGAITVTVPTGLLAQFGATIVQEGTGRITVTGSGLALTPLGSVTTSGTGHAIQIQCPLADTCHAWGN